jgi:NAD(P)-dependent dehydrogenase (short-subunit alcohol dehydrogenase family)
VITARTAIGLALGCGAGGAIITRLRRSARAIDFSGRTVVIFGGSRGLGLVMARELGIEGARIVLAARDRFELERAQLDLEKRGVHATTIPCDIRNRGQVDAAIAQVIDSHSTIDVLINDAGIIQVGPFERMTIADFEDAMATHFWGPLFTMLAALPHMRQAGARRIVNISSIGGKIAVPHLLPYSASKFALTGLSEGLRAELAQDGVLVTTVCPGLMRTGSTYNAWFKGQHRREFAWFHLSDSMPGISMAARRAARQIVEACRYGDAELILTMSARLAVWLNAASPGSMAKAMALANWMLPSAGPALRSSATARSGWQSVSRFVPSALTTLTDRASVENNELPVARG